MRLDKVDRIILKMLLKDKKVYDSFDEFRAAYLGCLAFLYIDTYGLPKRLVYETMGWKT